MTESSVWRTHQVMESAAPTFPAGDGLRLRAVR